MTQIATIEDFSNLRREILDNLDELKAIVSRNGTTVEQKWLKSADVKQLLGISHGTLQKMRDKNQIPYTKIDGIILYDSVKIERMINCK